MHLLYLQQLLILPGNPGNHRCWEFAKSWKAMGHEVSILTSHAALGAKALPNADKPYLFQKEGINIWVIPIDYHHQFSFPRRIWSFWQFYRQALKLAAALPKPDAILAYSAPLSVGELGRVLASRMGIPWFFEIADVWPDVPIGMGLIRFKKLGQWLQQRTQQMYAEASGIFPFSTGMEEQIQSHGVASAKIKVIPNGVWVDQVPQVQRVRPAGSPLELIYTGTLGLANDVSQLLLVMDRLRQWGRTDIRLQIVGDGNDADHVFATARKLKLDTVRFLGQVAREALISLWARADAGLISFAPYPVLEANAATKFFDYLAAGLPIVINYKGWQAAQLEAHDCGLSALQGDIDSMARHFIYLADHPEHRLKMGQNGRALAMQMYDRKELAPQMMRQMEKWFSLSTPQLPG